MEDKKGILLLMGVLRVRDWDGLATEVGLFMPKGLWSALDAFLSVDMTYTFKRVFSDCERGIRRVLSTLCDWPWLLLLRDGGYCVSSVSVVSVS
jgi:hypothetical protein